MEVWSITKSTLEELPIYLPSLNEQKAISAILATWDEAIEKTERLIALKKLKKKILLHNFFKQNSNHETCCLADVIKKIGDGGTPPRSKDEYFVGTIPWVVIEDIKREIYKTKEYLSELGFRKSSTKLWPQGAVILSTGATIGVVGIAMVVVCTKQGITGIVPNNNMLSSYLMYFFQANSRLLNRYAQGSSFKEIRPEIIKKLPIQIPPKERQKVVADLFKEVDKEIDILKSRSILLKTQKRGLMQKLLTGKWRVNIKEEIYHEKIQI